MISRDALLARFAQAETNLIYVHAPAGSGKSTIAALWLAGWEGGKASISLDRYDNESASFCRRFCDALARMAPANRRVQELAAHPALSSAPDLYAVHCADALAPDIRSMLVVDDLHWVDNPAIHELLTVLIEHLPKGVRVMALSRVSPPPAFSRFIVKEQMTLIPPEALAFSPEEIGRLYRHRGLRLKRGQAEGIHASTGGWAIAVNALLLSGKTEAERSLFDAHLENFLLAQVWGNWDASTQRFLLHTAFEEELTAPLCEALTGDEQAKQRLDKLLLEHAFLSKEGEGIYRFHQLFRTFLQGLARQNGEEHVHRQIQRAGDWYLERQDLYRAAERYTACGDREGIIRCFDLMEIIDREDFHIDRVLMIVHSSLNEEMIAEYPFLLYMLSYAAFLEGRAEDMMRFADRYYAEYPRIVQRNPELAHNILFLKALDVRQSMRQMVEAVRTMPHIPEMKGIRGTTTQNMPLFHRSFRDFSEYAQGDMESDIDVLSDTMGALLGPEKDMLVHLLRGGIQYEKGDLARAHESALSALAHMPDDALPESRFCAMLLHTHVLRASGREGETPLMIRQIDEMIEQESAYYLQYNWSAYQQAMCLARGDASSAGEWLAAYGTDPLGPLSFVRLYGHLTTARVHIALGNMDMAIVLLRKLEALCMEYQRPLDALEARILLAVAHWRKPKRFQRAGLQHLEEAILLANPYGYVQVFAMEGDTLLPMLHRLMVRSNRKDYEGLLPGSFVKRLYMAAVELSTQKQPSGESEGAAPRFTKRQMDVIRLMCKGYSYRQMAEALGVKFTTIRSHMELIYKKLDVPAEKEAIEKIRRLGILEEEA